MKKAGTKHFSKNSEKIKGKKLLLSSVFGALMGMGVLLLMLLIFSGICIFIDNPHKLILPLCFFAIYSSAFFTGLFSLVRNGSSDALLCGALGGTIFMISVWAIISLICYMLPPDNSSALSFIWKPVIIPVSIIGAFTGLSSKGTKTKRKF